MKNIDKELIDWAINKIKTEYPEDVALLIGQIGGCKIPTDEQNMSFDFFVPATERGNQMSQTFVIEDMGYDLYPISWERLHGIADFHEPRMIFAFAKGEVIYARSEEEREQFYELKRILYDNLKDNELTFTTALQFLNTAMEIFNTMLFEDSLCKVRKAAGGINCYLMNAVAMANGTYLKDGYQNLIAEMQRIKEMPKGFRKIYEKIIDSTTIEELQKFSYDLIKITRDYFIERKPKMKEAVHDVNYNDLADWYQEARYTFRQIEYYSKIEASEDCFLLGCYLQIEFDSICQEFGLMEMDLLGTFRKERLHEFAGRAKELETYLVDVLTKNGAELKIYKNLEEFLRK